MERDGPALFMRNRKARALGGGKGGPNENTEGTGLWRVPELNDGASDAVAHEERWVLTHLKATGAKIAEKGPKGDRERKGKKKLKSKGGKTNTGRSDTSFHSRWGGGVWGGGGWGGCPDSRGPGKG